MTALTYQKDARAYRFSLPNEIWGLKLPPPAFSILAYLCYLNSHHKGEAMPSVDEIAALLHMGVAMAQKQLDTLVKRNLISPQMVPVFTHKRAGKFFSLPNEIFSLDLGHGTITVYAYLLYCEDRSSHQCHPSYNTISATVGLAVNTVMKHIAKLEDRQFITVEHTSYFDRQGMKWDGNNSYTILPIQKAIDHSYERQMVKLEEVTERQRVAEELQKQGRVRPCEPLCAALPGAAGTDTPQLCLGGFRPISEEPTRTKVEGAYEDESRSRINTRRQVRRSVRSLLPAVRAVTGFSGSSKVGSKSKGCYHFCGRYP